MRRIYPQILQAEQAIQELRSELAQNEVTSRDQHVELNDASDQIQSLRNSLGAVERQKAVRRQSISISRHKTQELQERIVASNRDEESLASELGVYLEEGVRESALLEEAAAKRTAILSQVHRTEETIQDTASRGSGAEESCSGIQFSLKKFTREADNLQNELASANYHSTRQRRFMAEEESEASWQYDNTCEAHEANAQGHQRVDALEDCRRRLIARLQELEDAEQEGDELVVKLSQAHDVGVVLSTALGDLHQLVADRNGVLEEVCGEHSDLRRKLQESEQQSQLAQDEANELASARDETHARERQAHEELRTAEVRMQDAEGAMERDHQEAETQLVEASRRRATLHDQVGQLHEHLTNNLQQRMEGLEEENKHLQSKISFLEEDCAKISAENADMEQLIEKVKKKPNCVIS